MCMQNPSNPKTVHLSLIMSIPIPALSLLLCLCLLLPLTCTSTDRKPNPKPIANSLTRCLFVESCLAPRRTFVMPLRTRYHSPAPGTTLRHHHATSVIPPPRAQPCSTFTAFRSMLVVSCYYIAASSHYVAVPLCRERVRLMVVRVSCTSNPNH